MGHIGVVTRILDDTGPEPFAARITAPGGLGNLEIGVFAAWRDNCDAIIAV